MEDEGHGSVPGGLQHPVPEPPLVGAVVPLGQVAGAVRVLWGRPNLPAVDAAPTLEPGEREKGRGDDITLLQDFTEHASHRTQTPL
jgi:hypothetical protein